MSHQVKFPRIRRLLVLLFISGIYLISSTIFMSCGNKEDRKEKANPLGTISIVTTTGILADAVQHIGGDRVTVTALMGPGVDPHLFKASEGDVSRLASADIIVYNGLHLEGKMGEILNKMSRTRPVIAGGGLIPEERLLSPPQFNGQHDPHIWFDLSIWAEMVRRLSAEIGNIDTSRREQYLQNGLDYADQIMLLHEQVKIKIAEIPIEQRVLISAHDAFGYFGRAYNIEVRGLQGISTVSEYGLRDVSELVSYISNRKIKALFVESSVPARSIEAVKAGVQAQGHDVKIGGTLFSDALGEKGSPGGDYLGMVKYNVDTIVNALK